MVMTRIEWKRVSLLVAVVAALTAVTFANPDASVGAEQQDGGRGTAAIPTEPLYLPNHHYDLPATLVTAAQIQAHKAKMLADKDEDVPLNMVKSGGTGDKHQVGISVVYRLKGQSNPTYAVHDDVGEVYHVLEGAGTMLLGGKLKDVYLVTGEYDLIVITEAPSDEVVARLSLATGRCKAMSARSRPEPSPGRR